MSTIQNLFQQAQLAEAAYANFTSGLSTKEALIANNFSLAQADEFITHWRHVDQYTEPSILGMTGSGFSATLLINNRGQTTVSAIFDTLLAPIKQRRSPCLAVPASRYPMFPSI